MRSACALTRGSAGFDFEKTASCRVFVLAFEADSLRRAYRLRSILGANAAPQKASDLACAQGQPPVSSGPSVTWVQASMQ
jgi:hypothetical protein